MEIKYFGVKLGNDKKDFIIISCTDEYFHNKYMVAPEKFREFWKGFSEEQQNKIKHRISEILSGKTSDKSKKMVASAYNCKSWDILIQEITLFRKKQKQNDELEKSRPYLNMIGLSKWYEIEIYLNKVEEIIKEKMCNIEL
ncbi:MAG: hypothetical protein ACRCX2_01305 [Paraclostridium sp.]